MSGCAWRSSVCGTRVPCAGRSRGSRRESGARGFLVTRRARLGQNGPSLVMAAPLPSSFVRPLALGLLAIGSCAVGPARPPAPEPPTPALTVTHAARALQPGEVVLIEVRADAPLAAVTGSAFDRDLPFFRTAAGVWRALVGVDVARAPGEHEVAIRARSETGGSATAAHVLAVEAKTFPERRLRVAPKFVTPPPAARARIERERARLAEVYASSAGDVLWADPFVTPVEGAVASGFGRRSVFNNEPREPHGGADLASPTGTPVRATNAGRVALAGDLYFSGGTVVLDHGLGLFSLYAHLSRIDVREGDLVDRGGRVGAVGATGRVTGPHLHWGIRLHGARVDPFSLVSLLEMAGG
jgi:murein DD-endopeptidase MepM/ murein hydrolase activator NlpD